MSLKFKSSDMLRDLVNSVDWVAIGGGIGGKKAVVATDEVGINVKKSVKSGKTSITIRLGCELLEHLGWRIGKKIFISFHPSDLTYFYFLESPSGQRAIKKVATGHSSELRFVWPHDSINIPETKGFKVIKFDVFDGRLGLRLQ